jgi:hypothetical protein
MTPVIIVPDKDTVARKLVTSANSLTAKCPVTIILIDST